MIDIAIDSDKTKLIQLELELWIPKNTPDHKLYFIVLMELIDILNGYLCQIHLDFHGVNGQH